MKEPEIPSAAGEGLEFGDDSFQGSIVPSFGKFDGPDHTDDDQEISRGSDPTGFEHRKEA